MNTDDVGESERTPEVYDASLHATLTREIIGAAYEVHKHLGFGFLEKVYAGALLNELASRSLVATPEAPISVLYKGAPVGIYFADILVNDAVIVEVKAVRNLGPEHQAQVLNYLRATGIRVGLLLNFGTARVEIKRLVR